jgi:hypothetical protein
MHKYPFIVAVCVLVLVSLSGPSNAQRVPDPQAGRYQLTAGSYKIIAKGASRTLQTTGLFRIDTATGDVAELIEFIDEKAAPGARVTRSWSRVVE